MFDIETQRKLLADIVKYSMKVGQLLQYMPITAKNFTNYDYDDLIELLDAQLQYNKQFGHKQFGVYIQLPDEIEQIISQLWNIEYNLTDENFHTLHSTVESYIDNKYKLEPITPKVSTIAPTVSTIAPQESASVNTTYSKKVVKKLVVKKTPMLTPKDPEPIAPPCNTPVPFENTDLPIINAPSVTTLDVTQETPDTTLDVTQETPEQLISEMLRWCYDLGEHAIFGHITIDRLCCQYPIDLQNLLDVLIRYYKLTNTILTLPWFINNSLRQLYPMYDELADANYHTLNGYLDDYHEIVYGKPRSPN